MSDARVCVLGSFMMDLAVCAPRRPQPGETIVGTAFDTFLGGKGFNQAVAAARAGATTSMIGRVGDDDFGARFLDQLRMEGIDSSHVVIDSELGTGIGAPLIEPSGENSIVIVPRANSAITPADVERSALAITDSRVLLMQMELPADTALAAARIARSAGVTVVLNPAPAPNPAVLDEFAGLIDVLVPNEVEARTLCRALGTTPSEAASELATRLGTSVVLTLGGDGCLAVSDGSSFACGAHVVPVVDTVGAGDAFCGALGAWLAAGAPLPEAVAHANAAGALAVTRAGAEPAMPARHAIVDLAQTVDAALALE